MLPCTHWCPSSPALNQPLTHTNAHFPQAAFMPPHTYVDRMEMADSALYGSSVHGSSQNRRRKMTSSLI